MKTLKPFVVMCLLLIMLCAAGCTRFTSSGQKQVPRHVFTGTEGVSAEFIRDLPPRVVYEGQDFIVGLELHNNGKIDVDPGAYTIGIEQAVLEPQEDVANVFQLEGKNIVDQTGMKQTITLPVRAKRLGSETETYTSTITASVCYPYVTEADLVMCLDPDVTDDPRRQVCTMQSQSFGAGQGAPLVISRIEPRLIGTREDPRFDFIISIRNAGRGQVLAPDTSFSACQPFGIKASELNVVKLKTSVGTQSLKCGPRREVEPLITLTRGATDVHCVLEHNQAMSTAYAAPMRVELSYGYADTISTRVEIRKS